MRAFSVLQSTLTCRFAFPDILPALPAPGTPSFVQLCRGLKKFGLTADKVSIETPTTKLSDVRATFSLLNDAVVLRVQYGWFELFVPRVIKGQEDSLVEIAAATLSTIAALDEHAVEGQLVVHSLAHLALESRDPDSYIAEHFASAKGIYEPDAFAFNVTRQPGEMRLSGRIVVARSVIEGAVFVDYTAEYQQPRFTSELVQQLRGDYNDSLLQLGLSESEPGGGGNG